MYSLYSVSQTHTEWLLGALTHPRCQRNLIKGLPSWKLSTCGKTVHVWRIESPVQRAKGGWILHESNAVQRERQKKSAVHEFGPEIFRIRPSILGLTSLLGCYCTGYNYQLFSPFTINYTNPRCSFFQCPWIECSCRNNSNFRQKPFLVN